MTVFVIQKQLVFDPKTGDMVPRFPNLSKADRYGELEYLLSPTANPFHPEKVVGELRLKLREFSDKDYLLLIGNPVLIGVATAIAAANNEGRVAFLQWANKDNDYISVATRIF